MNPKTLVQREHGVISAFRYLHRATRQRFAHLVVSESHELQSLHRAPSNSLAIESNEDRYLLSGSIDATVSIFDLSKSQDPKGESPTQVPISAIKHGITGQCGISSVEWYPVDNGVFICASLDGTVRIWNTNTFTEVSTIRCASTAYVARSTLCSGSLLIAVATSDAAVKLCDPRMDMATHHLTGHESSVLSLQWSPANEYTLVTGSLDRSVRVWDVRKAGDSACVMLMDMYQDPYQPSRRTRNAQAHSGAVTSVAFSRSGLDVISASADDRLRLWDTESGVLDPLHFSPSKNTHFGHVDIPVSPFELLFFPNSTSSATISVFDLSNRLCGDSIAELSGHVGGVTACTLRKNYPQLVSSGADGMLLLWDSPRPPSRSQTGAAGDWDDDEDDQGGPLSSRDFSARRPRRRRRHNAHV